MNLMTDFCLWMGACVLVVGSIAWMVIFAFLLIDQIRGLLVRGTDLVTLQRALAEYKRNQGIKE